MMTEDDKVAPFMTNCVITGNPPYGYDTWHEWYNELGSKGILHKLRISSMVYPDSFNTPTQPSCEKNK